MISSLRLVASPRRYEEFSNEVDDALRAATEISEAEYDKIFSGPSSSALESDDFLDHAVTHAPHRYSFSSSSASATADGVPSSSWEDAAAELELASSRRRQDKLAVALQKQVVWTIVEFTCAVEYFMMLQAHDLCLPPCHSI